MGRDLAGAVATRMKTGLTADCTGLGIDDKGNLMQTRPAFGGNIMATIMCDRFRPQMSTVRPQVMPLPEKRDNAMICVSCPYCMTMFGDAQKDEGAGSVLIKDIAEVVAEGWSATILSYGE